jgi:hypothetical protein
MTLSLAIAIVIEGPHQTPLAKLPRGGHIVLAAAGDGSPGQVAITPAAPSTQGPAPPALPAPASHPRYRRQLVASGRKVTLVIALPAIVLLVPLLILPFVGRRRYG